MPTTNKTQKNHIFSIYFILFNVNSILNGNTNIYSIHYDNLANQKTVWDVTASSQRGVYMSIATELGNRIRFYRKQQHLSQEELAELCDFHPTYIGQLERGEKNATLESINKLSRGLGISLNELLKDIDAIDSAADNVSLEIYHKLLKLPSQKQAAIASILSEIIDLTQMV